MRTTMVMVAVAACLSAGCSSQTKPPPDAVSTPPGLGGTDGPPATQPSTRGADPKVDVDLTLDVQRSAATAALSAYLKARTQSVIAGRPVASLAKLTSARELARQRAIIRSALERGLTVSPEPRAAVVRVREKGTDRVILDVCFYLPATEYVDKVTGASPYGAIPRRWAPAVVTLTGSAVTWRVDKLIPPKSETVLDCKGL